MMKTTLLPILATFFVVSNQLIEAFITPKYQQYAKCNRPKQQQVVFQKNQPNLRHSNKNKNLLQQRSRSSQLSLTLPAGVGSIVESLFAYGGHVPIWQAASLNLALFLALRSKLLKILTEEGFWNAFALGTGLWTTLGWRGWTLCVLYLFAGSAVTKVKFEEKEKRGIAEGRGGRRGPENTW